MKTVLIAFVAWCGLAVFLCALFSFLKRHDRRANRQDNEK